MKVLMFGWEYAPQHTGGLGVACKELADELSKNHAISFILPKVTNEQEPTEGKVLISDVSKVDNSDLDMDFQDEKIEYLDIKSNLLPYIPEQFFEKKKVVNTKNVVKKNTPDVLKSIPLTGTYNQNLSAEVTKYTLMSSSLYEDKDYDVIHAHDWMGANAGMLAKAILKIPLIVHTHSTEYDRNGIGGNENIKALEKKAFEVADAIITVSEKTKTDIIQYYNADPEKITVVPNATKWRLSKTRHKSPKNLTIGFMGRMTEQKAPGKFIDLARSLESSGHKFEYIMIGDGYLLNHLERQVEAVNMKASFRMTGFLDQNKLKKALDEVSLLVIPSVSEPFGLVALEATAKGIPVIITENAGVNEFIPFKTFMHWDIHGMNKLVLSLITDSEKREKYVASCQREMKKLTWKKSVSKVESIYQELLSQ